MRSEDYAMLLDDLEQELTAGRSSVGILGWNSVTLRLLASLGPAGLLSHFTVYTPETLVGSAVPSLSVPLLPLEALAETEHDVLVVASDADKEELLLESLPFIHGTPRILLAGYGHLQFRDSIFHEERAKLLVPSLANGYPNSLVHLYQCLVNAARLKLSGVVAELGMFKGGTTMFLSRVVERLGLNCQVIGFDTFDGFPPRRSPLDMYDHPECVFTDLPAVQRYLQGRNVEIIAGDLVRTCSRLDDEDIVLTFVDTDNYSPTEAALKIVRERTLVGGAIVFDHFTGTSRFRYTLGERIAGRILLDDSRYFNLHGTGVFYRQQYID